MYKLTVINNYCEYCANRGQVYDIDKTGEGSYEKCPRCNNRVGKTIVSYDINDEQLQVIKEHIEYWKCLKKGITDL